MRTPGWTKTFSAALAQVWIAFAGTLARVAWLLWERRQ